MVIFFVNYNYLHMKHVLIAAVIAVQIIQTVSQAVYPSFQHFLRMFQKHYQQGEFERREAIYNANIVKFAEMKDFTPGVNKFTDWTPEQIAKLKNLKAQLPEDKTSSRIPDVNRKVGAPTSFDWRSRKAITSIKDQGYCGSCWAFAAAAHAESQLIIQGRFNDSIDLSEQYGLQCTRNSDCQGGYLNQATQAALNLPLQSAYPYNPNYYTIYSQKTVDCSYPDRINIAPNYETYYYLSDSQIISLLLQSPLIIGVSAERWEYYRYGVFSCPSYTYLTHAVLLIGYTPDYWIIKNQWGIYWGMEGYIHVTRNSSYNCLIGAIITRMIGNGDSSKDQKYKDIIKNSNTTNNATDNTTNNNTDNTTKNTTDNTTDNTTNTNTTDDNSTNMPNNTIIPISNVTKSFISNLRNCVLVLVFVVCLLFGIS